MTASSLPRWRVFGSAVGFAVLATFVAAGCNSAVHKKEPNKIEVIVTTPIDDDVIDYQDFTGRLDAFKTVEIRARVSGYAMVIPFKEGDIVHEGDLLVQIDSKPYLADLNLAEANLRLAEADASLQDKNALRVRQLIDTRGISREEYDTALATLEKAKATVGAMRAARDKAQVYVDYTRVTAPLTGRISRRNVDPGNLITADTTMLTTIVTESPVYVYFDVDERSFLDLKSSATPAHSVGLMPLLQSKVLMRLSNEDKFSRVGVVNFIDNRVVASTGTIRLRGVFENNREQLLSPNSQSFSFLESWLRDVLKSTKGDLKSGLFARVRMPTGKPYHALLIPDEAVQSDQGRKFVYLVNGDNEVVYRGGDDLELGQAIEGLRVVKKGLTKEDHVIVVGMQRVRPKQEVTVKKQDPPKRPESPLRS